MAYKYTVVGGVAIPNYVNGLAALTGLSGVFSYLLHHEMISMHGEKHPDSITRFADGATAFEAGVTAHQLYVFNKNLALMGDMDKKALATLTVRKSPTTLLMFTAGNVMLMASFLSSFKKRPS